MHVKNNAWWWFDKQKSRYCRWSQPHTHIMYTPRGTPHLGLEEMSRQQFSPLENLDCDIFFGFPWLSLRYFHCIHSNASLLLALPSTAGRELPNDIHLAASNNNFYYYGTTYSSLRPCRWAAAAVARIQPHTPPLAGPFPTTFHWWLAVSKESIFTRHWRLAGREAGWGRGWPVNKIEQLPLKSFKCYCLCALPQVISTLVLLRHAIRPSFYARPLLSADSVSEKFYSFDSNSNRSRSGSLPAWCCCFYYRLLTAGRTHFCFWP